ncbi:phage portal protein [Mycolicibacterium sp. Y3]
MFRAPVPPHESPETRNWSAPDPEIFHLLGAAPSLAGVSVSETSVMGLAAVYRSVQIIAGGIATLPLRALHESDGITQRVPSWLDNPGFGLTRFELIETTLAHLLLHGNAYLAHVYNGAGLLHSVSPIHPLSVAVEVDRQGVKSYRVSLNDGTQRTFTDATLTHIKNTSLDGIHGLSPLQLARHGAFGTAIAADKSAASLFGRGPTVSAIATVDDDLAEEDAPAFLEGLNRGLTGEANAGAIGLINRKATIHPLSISNEDSQWIQARQFQKAEIATIFGVPDSLVGLNDKDSSWGTGIAEMHRAMVAHTFNHWTSRIAERLSLLLPSGRKAEFDYKGLLAPDPKTEIELLIAQVDAGLLSHAEARQILNRPPLPEAEPPEEPVAA